MDDPQPQRRPFQFSLRKLMLWTAVWALYLGIVARLRLPAAVVLTIYLMALLAVHTKWGFEQGVLRSTLITGFVVGAVSTVVGLVTGWSAVEILAYMPLACIVGLVLGLFSSLVVYFVASAVDWIDDLMQTKSLRDQ